MWLSLGLSYDLSIIQILISGRRQATPQRSNRKTDISQLQNDTNDHGIHRTEGISICLCGKLKLL